MSIVQDSTSPLLQQEKNSTSPLLQEKKEPQGIITVQSMVKCIDEEDLFDYPPPPLEPSTASEEEDSSALSHHVLLEHEVSNLERQESCDSVDTLSEDGSSGSSNADEGHEGAFSDDNVDAKKYEEVEEPLEGTSMERSTSVVSDVSEEGGLDSGIEAEKDHELGQMVVPERAIMEKIATQVEFYFSDANVVKDKFLLKHIRRNKEGFVSLKLVSSFKKVKQLTKDWRIVAYSLEHVSSLIQINDQKTKIRRVEPLPEIDDSPVTCAVLALDLPLEKPSVETVSKLFGSVGDIAFVRVLRAGGALPPDIKSLLTKYPILGEKHCAWIEFETPETAKAATELSEEGGMRVVLIVPDSQKKQEKKQQQQLQQQQQHHQPGAGNRKHSAGNYIKGKSFSSRKGSFNHNTNYYGAYNNNLYHSSHFYHQVRPRKDSHGGSDYEAQRPSQRRKAVSLPSNQNPFFNDPRRTRPKSKSCTEYPVSGSPPTSWVQRNLLAAAAASAASAASPVIGARPPSTRISRVSTGSLPLPEGILRFPKGPDGSKGFGRDRRFRQISESHSRL